MDTDSEGEVFRFKSEFAPSIQEIDTQFMGMLLGVNSLIDHSLNRDEKKALQLIRNWSQQETLPVNMVPRLPSVIPKIMIAVRDEKSTAQDLANLISDDLSLVGEVIRLSNSAYYRSEEKVDSLKQAIVKLGLNGIRQLISTAAFKPILNPQQGKLSSVLSKLLWRKNQKAAMAGNFLAMNTEDDRFHAYLAGLLCQAGLLVIIKQLDDSFDNFNFPRSIPFMDEIDRLSKTITIQISRQWEMPEGIIQALEEQLNDNAPENISSLGQVCYVADRLAKISILEQQKQLNEMENGIQCRIGRINSRICNQCFTLINLDQQD